MNNSIPLGTGNLGLDLLFWDEALSLPFPGLHLKLSARQNEASWARNAENSEEGVR